MEPIGLGGELEANGTIYRFCHNNGNDRCRIKFLNAHPDESLKRGVDPDAIDGTVCDQCGAVLVDDSPNAAAGAEIASRL